MADTDEWAGWLHDEQLVEIYTKRIEKAFHEALMKGAAIISEWWRGTLTMTRQDVVDTISDLVKEELAKVLKSLWEESWYLGSRAAAIAISHDKPDFGQWRPGHGASATAAVANESGLQHLVNAYGVSVLQGIARTRMDKLEDELTNAARAGKGPAGITSRLEDILNVSARAPMIASTEVRRAVAVAAMDKYKQVGVTRKQWLTPPEGACPICKENEAQGPLPLAAPFMSGALCSPQHPYCRCIQVPGDAVNASGHLPPGMHAVINTRDVPEHVMAVPGHVKAMIQEDAEKGLTVDEITQVALEMLGKKRDVPPDSRAWGGGSGMGARSVPERAPQGKVPRSTSDQRSGTSAPLPSAGGEPPKWDAEDDEVEEDEYDPDTPGEFDLEGQASYLQSRESSTVGAYPRTGIPGGFPTKPAIGTGQPDSDNFTIPRNIPQAPGVAQTRGGPNEGKYPPFARGRPPGPTGKVDGNAIYQAMKQYGLTLQQAESLPPEALELLQKKKHKIKTAGLVIHADDTGRVLLRQRGLEKEDIPDLTKDAADLTDANHVEAEHVMNQMRKNYPEKSIQWMKDATWIGPVLVPHERIDYDDKDKWAASHQPRAVNQFAKEIKAGCGHCHPVVMVQKPGELKVQVIDGHHRTLAYKKLGQKVKAYIGRVNKDVGPWDQTHSFQIHQGASPLNKGDDAEGKWEIPGGHLDGDESSLEAAQREWCEETGLKLPKGEITGNWVSSNGKYQGFILTIPEENGLKIMGHDPGGKDPGNHTSDSLAWWEPKEMKDNPAVREEILDDFDRFMNALGVYKSAPRSPIAALDRSRSQARAMQRDQAIRAARARYDELLQPHTRKKEFAIRNAQLRYEQAIRSTADVQDRAKNDLDHADKKARVARQMASHLHEALQNARRSLDPDFPSHRQMLDTLERAVEEAQRARSDAEIHHGLAKDRHQAAKDDHDGVKRMALDAMNAECKEANRVFGSAKDNLERQRDLAIQAARRVA